MKIIVPAIGSRGDVQPYIALCQGLQKAGHEAILATNPTLVQVVESNGVCCAPVGPPVDMGAEGAKIWEKAGKNWWLGFLRIMQLGMSLVEKSHEDLFRLIQTADLVIATDVMAGAAEADRLGKPWFSVTLQPGRIADPDRRPPLLMRLFMPIINRLVMAPTNRFRKRIGAPPAKGDISGMMSDRLVLLPVSRHVSPPNPRWPAHIRVTGYWFAESPETWQPPSALVDFINNGEKPVAVSLGAMSLSGNASREAAQITVEAIRQAGVRAIIQGWDAPLSEMTLPQTIFHAGSMPHTWLFGQVRAVVHHGGFGTTASALAAGAPAVIVPHIIDQIFWAQHVYELGAGPKPVSRGDLSVEKLSSAIRQATQDEQMIRTAAGLGEKIRGEPDGVQAAVEIINEAASRWVR